MKKPDLMELNSTDLTKYKNQLESMIKEEKKCLQSLQQEKYEIMEKNKFLREHAEELTKIVNTCHQTQNLSSRSIKFVHDQEQRIFELYRSLQYLFPGAQFLSGIVQYPQHIIDKLVIQKEQPSTWSPNQNEIIKVNIERSQFEKEEF